MSTRGSAGCSSERSKSLPRWAVGLVAWLGRGYVRLIRLTSRYSFEGLEGVKAARAKGVPVLLVFWHNRLVGPILPHRHQSIGVVVSQSQDGEVIARVIQGFGYEPLRGSSTRGGSAVLRGVLRHLRGGKDVAFTPDGPKGPRYTVQPGVAYVARKTGYPVVPMGVGMSRKRVFGSWDRFQLPLPFGAIRMCYGEPLWFGEDHPEAEVVEAIRASVAAATERADLALGVVSP